MRWAYVAIAAAAPAFFASITGCGSSDTETTGSGGQSAGGGGSNGTAGGNTGGATSSTTHSGGTGGTGGDTASSSTGSGDVYPAVHPAPHTIVSAGGPVMSAQKIVPVFFSNDNDPDATKSQIKDFLAKLQTSTYVASAGAEYGVGAATVLPPIELAEAAPDQIDDAEIQTWLVDKIEAGDGVFPPADGNTIYILYYPEGTLVTSFGSDSCVGFLAYHLNTYLHDGTPAIYAPIPRCPAGQGVSTLDNITQSTSHELLEAATDPIPFDQPAYEQLDDKHIYVQDILLAEIGDQCAFSPSGFTAYPDLPYSVQRVYSDASALAGHNPCIPIPGGEVYFAAAPNPPDAIDFGGGSPPEQGTRLAIGQSKEVDVVFFSDAPVGAWKVYAVDSSALYGGPALLEFSFDKDTGKNGDHVKMTIKALRKGDSGLASYLIYSINGGEMNVWPGFVFTP